MLMMTYKLYNPSTHPHAQVSSQLRYVPYRFYYSEAGATDQLGDDDVDGVMKTLVFLPRPTIGYLISLLGLLTSSNLFTQRFKS